MNLNKFLFIFNRTAVASSVYGNLNLKTGAVLTALLLILFNTIKLTICVTQFSLTFFFQEFLTSILCIISSVYVLFSVSDLSKTNSFWGYMYTAFAVWTQWVLYLLTYTLRLVISPISFFRKYWLNLGLSFISSIITVYCSWIIFSYAKHVYDENFSILEGKDKLVANETEKEHDSAIIVGPTLATEEIGAAHIV
jgi:hypothetical protein